MSENETLTSQTDPTKLSPKGRKALIAGGIGNTVEWVDWSVYAIFSSIFAQQFFPPGDEAAALLGTLAIFAVGFVMRPIGALFLGSYADRLGRKKGLMLTIGMMAGAALVISVTPTYETIGIFAPIILLLARLVQGFSAGGEFGSSSAFMVESAAPKRRAFAGSWQQVSVGAGGLLASGMGYVITSTLPPEAVESWGWRLAFFIGAMLGVVGLWLRVAVEETDSFTRMAAERDKAPAPKNRGVAAFAMFTKHPYDTLRVFGITIAGTLLYYMWVSFMPTFAHLSTGMPLSEALLANVIALIIFVVLLPFAGLLSDIVGRKPTMTAFAGGFLVLSWPAFSLLNGNFWMLLVIEVVGMILLLGYSGNCAVIMAEQFPAEVRAAGIGFPYALAVAIFGGTAPFVTTWFLDNGLGDFVWLYCAAAALIGVIVYMTMPETKAKELD